MHTPERETEFGPWNPGIESTLPAEFVPLATLFRPENGAMDLTALRELSGFSGIPIEELAAFRPERLVVHELLIRVIADLNVPDGAKYEDLGRNFRSMTSAILSKYILPRMDEVKQLHSNLGRDISALLDREIEASFEQP